MEDIKMLEEILLKLNILCGKIDTLEAKINKIVENKSTYGTSTMQELPKPPEKPDIPDVKAIIEKARAEAMAKINASVSNGLRNIAKERHADVAKNNLIKGELTNISKEKPYVPKKIGKIGE